MKKIENFLEVDKYVYICKMFETYFYSNVKKKKHFKYYISQVVV